ncbi:MAG TPA: phosphatase PAP2 family protein [Candidatus Gracilibacteria bacterium]
MKQSYQWIRQAALKAFERELFLWLGIFLFLLGIGRALDYEVFGWLEPLRNPWLDTFFVFLTEQLIYAVIGAVGVIMFWRLYRNDDHKSKLVPALFAVSVTLVAVAISKAYFKMPRPYMVLEIQPLVDIASYSFPSGHTAAAFALTIPFFRISKTIGVFWLWWALFIGFGRVYEGVHYPSDIAAGIFLGGLIGSFFSNPDIQKWIVQKWEEREFRRQTFHLVTGFLFVFLHWADLLRLRYLGGVLILGLAVSLLSQYYKIPIVSYVLERFDRPRDRKFPGRGAFYFFLSVFFIFLVFNGPYIKIAYASILILAVGDSFNHYMAPRFNEKAIPWNKRKLISGLCIGVIMGTFAAQFFVSLYQAFAASLLALIVETFDIKIGPFYLDDNLTVPFVAAFTIYFMTQGFDFGPLITSSMTFFETVF